MLGSGFSRWDPAWDRMVDLSEVKKALRVRMERSQKWVNDGGSVERVAQKWPGKAEMKVALWGCGGRLGS